MEIVARRLAAALPGERIESVVTPGINVLKTFDPPLSALDGATFRDVRRRGKLLLLEAETESHGPLTLLIHLMSAGRMMLYDKRASMKDRTSRVLIRLPGDRLAISYPQPGFTDWELFDCRSMQPTDDDRNGL